MADGAAGCRLPQFGLRRRIPARFRTRRHGCVIGIGPQRHGGAGGNARRSRERLVAFIVRDVRTLGQGEGSRSEDGQRSCGRASARVRESTQAAYRARMSLSSTGFYRTRRFTGNKATMSGRAVLLLRIRRGRGGGRAGYAHRRDAGSCGWTSFRRRRFAESGDRSGQIEGGYLQGAGWLALRRALVERQGRAADARAVDLQDSHSLRLARDMRTSSCSIVAQP